MHQVLLSHSGTKQKTSAGEQGVFFYCPSELNLIIYYACSWSGGEIRPCFLSLACSLPVVESTKQPHLFAPNGDIWLVSKLLGTKVGAQNAECEWDKFRNMPHINSPKFAALFFPQPKSHTEKCHLLKPRLIALSAAAFVSFILIKWMPPSTPSSGEREREREKNA